MYNDIKGVQGLSNVGRAELVAQQFSYDRLCAAIQILDRLIFLYQEDHLVTVQSIAPVKVNTQQAGALPSGIPQTGFEAPAQL